MKVASIEAIVRALNAAQAPFIIVGGLAVNAHGYGRYTADIDLVLRLSPDAVKRAFDALASLGYAPRVPVTSQAFADPTQRERWVREKGMTVLNFHSDRHRDTPIDLFVTEPFDFEEEYGRALVVEVAADVPARVVSLPTLARLKRAAGRLQDLADIEELSAIHGKIADA